MGISSYSSSVISVHVSTKCPQYLLLTLLVKDKIKLITDSQQTKFVCCLMFPKHDMPS